MYMHIQIELVKVLDIHVHLHVHLDKEYSKIRRTATHQKKVAKLSLPNVKAFSGRVEVAEHLHVDDGKEHEEDAREYDDHQQLAPVPNDLEEEEFDFLEESQEPRQTSSLQISRK